MKVPEPRKLPSGNWFIQLRLNGQSVPVLAATEKECRDRAALLKAEHRAGKAVVVAGGNISLGEAIDNYIANKSNTISPATVRGYKVIRNNRVQAQMGKKLRDIKNWQQIINAEAKTVAPKTIKNTWRFLCSVLRENGITPPRIVLPLVPPAERPWLDPDEIKIFVSALDGHRYIIPILLALHGLRLSEIMALTWDKIDLKKNAIRVSGAAVLNENNRLELKKANKNRASTRTVPIMIPALLTALKDVEDKRGPVVLCHPNTVYANINRMCKSLSLPEVGVHGLRHSFASLAYHLGWSEQQTMEVGGWSDTTTMHKIYTHLAAADRLKAQNTMADFYQK